MIIPVNPLTYLFVQLANEPETHLCSVTQEGRRCTLWVEFTGKSPPERERAGYKQQVQHGLCQAADKSRARLVTGREILVCLGLAVNLIF